MDYQRIYREFIADRKSKPKPSGYTERHHILPRSLGGGNEPKNLISLTAEDHLFAHVLLAKAYGGAMWAPVLAAFGQWARDRPPTAREIRLQATARQKSREAMQGSGNPFFGQRHRSETIESLRDQAVYELAHFSGRVERGSRRELSHRCAIPIKDVARLVVGGRLSAGGWFDPRFNPAGATPSQRISKAHASPEVFTLYHASGAVWTGTRLEFSALFGANFYIQPGSKHCLGWHLRAEDARDLPARVRNRAVTASRARGDISGHRNPMAGSDRRKDIEVSMTHRDGSQYQGSLKAFADERAIDAKTYGRLRKTLLGKKVVNGQIVKSFWGWSLAT